MWWSIPGRAGPGAGLPGTEPVARRARQSTIDFAQLGDLPLALPTRSHGLRRTLEQAATQADRPLNVVFEMDALELMKEIVLEGLAHTVLACPQWWVNSRPAGSSPAESSARRCAPRLMLATASNRPLTQAVRLVQDILRELLQDMVRAEPYRSYMRMTGACSGAG